MLKTYNNLDLMVRLPIYFIKVVMYLSIVFFLSRNQIMINVFSKNKYVKSYSILKLFFLFNTEET